MALEISTDNDDPACPPVLALDECRDTLEMERQEAVEVNLSVRDQHGRALADLDQCRRERDEARELVERIKLEAQDQAGEAKAQRSSLIECYHAVGAKRGDWNGANPVREYVAQAQTRIAELEAGYDACWEREQAAEKRATEAEADLARLRDALERIEAMAARPVCTCGVQTGTAAIRTCARAALRGEESEEEIEAANEQARIAELEQHITKDDEQSGAELDAIKASRDKYKAIAAKMPCAMFPERDLPDCGKCIPCQAREGE